MWVSSPKIFMTFFGSKSRIAKQIVPILQKCIDDNNIHFYLEPFVGGANVIDKIRCDRKFGYDIDKFLIYLFIHLKSGGTLPDFVDKETYDRARTAWYNDNKDGEFEDWEIGAIGHLSSHSARNFSGGYGVISGNRNLYDERKRNLLKQISSPLWQDIMFGISDYKDLDNLEGYVIYCDPDYRNTKKINPKSDLNYSEFWDTMRKWSENNYVFISELEAPDDFECIWKQEIRRDMGGYELSKNCLFIHKD